MFTIEWKKDEKGGLHPKKQGSFSSPSGRDHAEDIPSSLKVYDGTTSKTRNQRNKPAKYGEGSRDKNQSKKAVSLHKSSSAMQQTSIAALGAVAAYATLCGSIRLFHHARRSLLRQLLRDLAPNLSHTTYWLDFGSLLGLHRDGDLILHDNDIDLAIYQPNWDELLDHLQQSLPQYCVRLEYPSEAPDVCFMRVYCSLGFADLFGAVEIDAGRLLVDCGHGDITSIDAELVLPTQTLEWRDTTINVPKNLPGTLHARYGPTWHIPRYLDKGADTVEGNKTYARIFRALSKVGITL